MTIVVLLPQPITSLGFLGSSPGRSNGLLRVSRQRGDATFVRSFAPCDDDDDGGLCGGNKQQARTGWVAAWLGKTNNRISGWCANKSFGTSQVLLNDNHDWNSRVILVFVVSMVMGFVCFCFFSFFVFASFAVKVKWIQFSLSIGIDWWVWILIIHIW